MKKHLFILLFLLFGALIQAQSTSFSGNIYGFFGEKVMLLKKASKNLGFEGPISGVKITVKGSQTNLSLYSDISGAYSFAVPGAGEYTLSISKEDYSTLNFVINYKEAGIKSAYSLLSFVIRKDDHTTNNIGALTIKDAGSLSYSASDPHQKNGNQDVIQSNKILFEKAVSLNNSSKKNIVTSPLPRTEANTIKSGNEDSDIIGSKKRNKNDSIAIKHSNDLVNSLTKAISDTTTSAEDIKKQIELSKQLLNTYHVSDPNYQLLQNQIKNAEAQLTLKENYLKVQEKELGQARKMITFMVLMVIIAVALIGFMFYYINEKRKFSKTLSAKNVQIGKINDRLISSIKYASVIQSNLLMDKAHLKRIFSNSFVYYQPKDFLSGDFYWFGEAEDSKIIIAADCTGHGVPGALLTVLGHGIIAELVEKKKLTSPRSIITELNNQLNLAFSNQNLMEYGIELTVMCFKNGEKKVAFASNGHGIYKYSDGEILHYLPIINGPSKSNSQAIYEDVTLDYKKNDCFYLMSDGYCDQFKGESVKPEKFNLRRFETILNRISENNDVSLGEKELEDAFISWKGEKEQTDDVLVIGFRV